MKNNKVFIKKYTEFEKITDIKTQSMSKKKDVLVILHHKKRMSFNYLIKTVLEKTSNCIFNMELVDLEEL